MRDLAKAIGVKYDEAFSFEENVYEVDSYSNKLLYYNLEKSKWEFVDYSKDPDLLWRLIAYSGTEYLDFIALSDKEKEILDIFDATKVFKVKENTEVNLCKGDRFIASVNIEYFPFFKSFKWITCIKKVEGHWVV